MECEININKLKVLTYNIWFSDKYRHERLISLIETINSCDADIICLQEVMPDIFNYIKLCQKKDYPYIFPNKLETDYHCVILSKHPFTSTEEHTFTNSTMGRKLIYVTINLKLVRIVKKDDDDDNDDIDADVDFNVENYKVTVATSHFESQFGQFNKRKIDQYIKAKEILDDVGLSGSVILCADTNITKKEEKYYLTKDDNWIDSWKEDGSDNEKEYTYDSKTNDNLKNNNYEKEYQNRLDRIVYTKNDVFKTIKFDLIRGLDCYIEPSDHYGVMATFEFK